MKNAETSIERLNQSKLFDLAKFIVDENFKHHEGDLNVKDLQKDIEAVYKEEMDYFSSSNIYISLGNDNSITGSIRVLKWNKKSVLPIQKLFNINPLKVVNEIDWTIKNIYHIGRFAVKKDVKDINLFKKLMVKAIEPICSQKNSIAFAECDKKLLRVMRLLGIEASVIGKSIEYLGSETFPIVFSYHSVIDFYNKNKQSVSINREMLPPVRYMNKKSIQINKQRM